MNLKVKYKGTLHRKRVLLSTSKLSNTRRTPESYRILDKKIYFPHSIQKNIERIVGVGKLTSIKVCRALGYTDDRHPVNEPVFVDHLLKVSSTLSKLNTWFAFNLDLRERVKSNLLHLHFIKCNRGARHSVHLPVHGQRTHNNAKTSRKLGKKYCRFLYDKRKVNNSLLNRKVLFSRKKLSNVFGKNRFKSKKETNYISSIFPLIGTWTFKNESVF